MATCGLNKNVNNRSSSSRSSSRALVKNCRELSPPWQILLVNQAQDPVDSAGHLSSGPRSEFTNAKLTIFSSSKEQVSATNGDSLFPRKRSIAGSVTALYYYDEEKERIIHLLLHILFIFDLISISMDNITYYFVITALTSINAFLLINCVGFLYSSLLGLIMLLLICYMFARANVISVCKDVNFRHAVNDPLPLMTVR